MSEQTSTPKAAPSAKPSEALAVLMLILPLLGVALVWLWIAPMGLLQHPQSALLIVLAAVILGSASLGAVEASQIGSGTRRAIGWFFALTLLWIVCYPLYLFQRSRYGLKNLALGGSLVAILFAGSAYRIESAARARVAEFRSGGDRLVKAEEASMNLRQLFDSAVSYYEPHHEFPHSVSLSPAVSCCDQGGTCKPDPSAFADESWAALSFSLDDPHLFQYELVASGTGGGAKFTVRAVGDPGCTGHKMIFQRSGHVNDDGSVASEGLETIQ
jgi:hypothetical protein